MSVQAMALSVYKPLRDLGDFEHQARAFIEKENFKSVNKGLIAFHSQSIGMDSQ
jgi:hypothetical protein